MTSDGRPFKSTCRSWLGHQPCAVQRATGQPDCTDCEHYCPAASTGVTAAPDYRPAALLSARTVCIVEAGGLGSVLRTTAVSRAIRLANPRADIRWITHNRGVELLASVPGVRPIDADMALVSSRVAATADVLVNFDTRRLGRDLVPLARTVAGLRLNDRGRFEPASFAEPLQRLQIDDAFRRSSVESLQKVLVGTLGLTGVRAQYDVSLPEQVLAAGRRAAAGCFTGVRPSIVIGLNIGSSRRGRLKRWPAYRWAELAVRLVRGRPNRAVLLLSGPDDGDARSATLAALERLATSRAEAKRIRMPASDQAVLSFLGLVASLDLVVTADTFALHAAAALDVPVVAVVGPMPHRELEIGVRDPVVGPALTCAPCYYRCGQPVAGACMAAIEAQPVIAAVEAHLGEASARHVA